MNGWEKDKIWSDFYLPQIRQIVGPLLLEPAPIDVDQYEATDLMVLKAKDLRIACRIRRDGYQQCYPRDVTIRAFRPLGAKTELQKIEDGFCDLSFYGHASSEGSIERYFVYDLDVFREALKQDPYPHRFIQYENKMNTDGSSGFRAYDIRSLPHWIIKASSHDVPFLWRDAA